MSETIQEAPAAMRPRRRTQEERRAETKASVLRAARTVFSRRGLRGASLEEIAEEAGGGQGGGGGEPPWGRKKFQGGRGGGPWVTPPLRRVHRPGGGAPRAA